MYWGYDSRSAQYDANAGILTFQRTGTAALSGSDFDASTYTRKSVSAETSANTEVSGRDRFGMPGVDVAMTYTPEREVKGFGFGLSIGVSGFWHGTPRVTSSSFRARVTEEQFAEAELLAYDYALSQDTTETYVYSDLGEVLPNLPESYAGADQGDLWAVGPVIPNLPTSRDLAVGPAVSSVAFTGASILSMPIGERNWGELYNHIDLSADLDRYVIWLGGSIEREIGSLVNLYVTPRISISYVDGEASRHETLFLVDLQGQNSVAASWHDSRAIEHWSFGAGVSGGADVALGEKWSVGLRGGIEWLENDIDLDVGPNRVAIDMDNTYGSLTVTREL